MELIRDLEKRNICLIDNDKKLLETLRLGAEFVICLYTDEPIVITQQTDEYLNKNLKQIMQNEYVFGNNLSYKKGNEIRWFSDQYCNMEDEEETNMVNRLILRDLEDQIQISYENPYLKKLGIKRSKNFIAFSPCGNGFYSKNVDSGLTFQDDIVQAFINTFRKKYNDSKKLVHKRNN